MSSLTTVSWNLESKLWDRTWDLAAYAIDHNSSLKPWINLWKESEPCRLCTRLQIALHYCKTWRCDDRWNHGPSTKKAHSSHITPYHASNFKMRNKITFGPQMFWTAMQSSGLYRPSHLGLSRHLLDGRSIQNMSYIHQVKRQGHGTISHSSHCTFCHT